MCAQETSGTGKEDGGFTGENWLGPIREFSGQRLHQCPSVLRVAIIGLVGGGRCRSCSTCLVIVARELLKVHQSVNLSGEASKSWATENRTHTEVETAPFASEIEEHLLRQDTVASQVKERIIRSDHASRDIGDPCSPDLSKRLLSLGKRFQHRRPASRSCSAELCGVWEGQSGLVNLAVRVQRHASQGNEDGWHGIRRKLAAQMVTSVVTKRAEASQHADHSLSGLIVLEILAFQP